MRPTLIDDHFRAAAVPSRTQAPEAVLLWDGLPAALPLRSEMVPGTEPGTGPEAVVLDANGRELRRFVATPETPSDDPAAMAAALIDRLEQLCRTGQVPPEQRSSMGSVTVGAPVGAEVVASSSGAGRKIALVLAVLFISLVAGIMLVVAAGEETSEDPASSPQGQTEPAATPLRQIEPAAPEPEPAATPAAAEASFAELRQVLLDLHAAQQKELTATGAYAADPLQLGVAPPQDVVVEVVLGGPDRYVATAARPPATCTLTVKPGVEPRVDCESPAR